jgi:hypothetical protein
MILEMGLPQQFQVLYILMRFRGVTTPGAYIYSAFGIGKTGEFFEYKGVVYLTR